MEALLEFEKPIADLERKLFDLRQLSREQGVDLSNEIAALEKKLEALIKEVFSNLSPWQRVQLSRHPNRPYTRDYIENLFPDFMELHGDRSFSDDAAIMAGVATWPPRPPGAKLAKDVTPTPVFIIGHQKGRTTKQKMLRNFGMSKPEGYRKSMRVFQLAERSRLPIITLVDTPGAYPGIETEERGQAQAIAESITALFELKVPVVSIVLGEGGSGGALALGVADRVYMQQHSVYSVISPEGCASILWSDAKLAPRAAEVLKMGAGDLTKLGVVDGIIPEPRGGAHRNWDETFRLFRKFLIDEIDPMIRENNRIASGHLKPSTTTKRKKVTKKTTKVKKKSSTATAASWDAFTAQLRAKRLEKFRMMGSKALGKTMEPRKA